MMRASDLRRWIGSGRNSGLMWRYVFNLSSTAAYRFSHHSLPDEERRLLRDLDRDGVAMTSAASLLEGGSCFDRLAEAVASLEQDQADAIAAARRDADRGDAIGSKTFIYPLLGEKPVLDVESIWARFALQPPLLRIVNAYFGMFTQLRYYNVWHTFATQTPPRESQLWHRDREDYQILKLFVYLSDVDAGAGPFTYARRTHRKGNVRREPACFIESGVKRSGDREMAAVVPSEQWVTATGRKGTIVFADTRGYHKGGGGRERDRLIYTCMFTSPASQVRELFERPERCAVPADRALALALGCPKRRGA
jgi:hypothetical protein